MATIDLASNSALLSVAEKIAEQNQLLNSIAVRGKSVFVRYSAYADGTDFTETWSAGQNYIGHAVDFEAPTDKTAYTWSLFASNMRETLNITLAADAWVNDAQTIETLAIGDNSTVFPAPAPGSRDAYINAGIQISAATSNSLIFTCAEVPTTDIVVEVFVTEPTAVVGGGGGLGQSDWAAGAGEPGEILNKPFYDEAVELGETITWDGTLDDNTIKQADRNVDLGGTKLNVQVYTQYVSSSVPTIDELATGTAFAISTGASEPVEQEMNLANRELINTNGVIAPRDAPVVMVATKDNSAADLDGATMRLPKKGIYVLKMVATQEGSVTEQVINKLTIPGYNFVMGDFKKLDSKFVSTPDWNAGVGVDGEILNRPFYDYTQEFGDTVTWDGEAIHDNDFIMDFGPMAKMQAHYMAANIPTVEELLTGTFTLIENGESFEMQPTESNIKVDEATGIINVGDAFAVVPTAGAVLFSIATLKQPGIYALYEGDSNSYQFGSAISIPGYNFYASNFKKIDSKFIDAPDWEAIETQVGYIKNRPFGKVIGTGDTLHKDIGYGELVSIMGFINCYHMCDKVLTTEELIGGTIEIAIDGTENVQLEITEDTFGDMFGDGGTICIQYKQENSNMPVVFVIPESGYTVEEDGLSVTFNKPGIYFNTVALLGMTTVSLHIPGYEFPAIDIQQIDEKYIPDTFVRRDELEATIGTINGAATVGQAIIVKAVDENGRPTEWEAVDMPTFELVSPNGTRYNLAVADDGTLSAVAVVEEPVNPEVDPTDPEVTDPTTDPEADPTEPTGDAT